MGKGSLTLLWEQLGQTIEGEQGEGDPDITGYSVSLNAEGNIVAVGDPNRDINPVDAGRARIFRYNNTTKIWDIIGEFKGEIEEENFGVWVSLNDEGTIIAVAGNSGSKLQIYSYVKDNEWNELLDPALPLPDSLLGLQLSGDGTRIGRGSNGAVSVADIDRVNSKLTDLGTIDLPIPNIFNTSIISSAYFSLNDDGSIVATGYFKDVPAGSDITDTIKIYRYNGNNYVSIGEIPRPFNNENSSDVNSEIYGLVALNADGTILITSEQTVRVLPDIDSVVRVFKYNPVNNWSLIGSFPNIKTIVTEVACNSDGTIVSFCKWNYYREGQEVKYLLDVEVFENTNDLNWNKLGQTVNTKGGVSAEKATGAIDLNANGNIFVVGDAVADSLSGVTKIYELTTVRN